MTKKNRKKHTVYLDWVPVEVTYTPPAPTAAKIEYSDGLVSVSVG